MTNEQVKIHRAELIAMNVAAALGGKHACPEQQGLCGRSSIRRDSEIQNIVNDAVDLADATIVAIAKEPNP
jgi:hypothetical protein